MSDIFQGNIYHHQIFQASDAQEPYLSLRLMYHVVGDCCPKVLDHTTHPFVRCSPAYLCAFLAEKEPIPLDSVASPGDARTTRENISNKIYSLVRNCVGVHGLKELSVIVVLEIKPEKRMMLLCKRTMGMLHKEVYNPIGKNENEVCAICMDEMRVRQNVALTPCLHRFHEVCIAKWFEKKLLCPVCRFDIERLSREDPYRFLL